MLGFLLMLLFGGCAHKNETVELKVLQFNIWQEGTSVENGFEGIVDNIVHVDPDLVTFSEVRNYHAVDFMHRLISALEKKGKTYYGERSVSTGILSKYKVQRQEVVYPLGDDRGSVIKALITVGDHTIALYSAHLDWLNCSYYLPRAYGSSDWKQLEQPIVDVDALLADNRASYRDDEIRALIADAKKEKQNGSMVIIGGDFNEPSHADWQENTKDMRDHNGVVINWDCSLLLTNEGYIDTFRERYPDPVQYPGFTFAADNKAADLKKLVWAPDADERERIDFIYYFPLSSITLKEVKIVGPSGSILHGKRAENESKDTFILPVGTWPTDHKALLSTFILQANVSHPI